jgi:putative AbiEii toxin of type IV toxin-antitoxin system
MEIEMTVKNYRCFPEPVRITLRKGFTAFVGANNSGKSSLLKFFYEFRTLFAILGNAPSALVEALRDRWGKINVQGTLDSEEVFCNSNTRDIEFEFTFKHGRPYTQADPTRLIVRLHRDFTLSAKLYFYEANIESEVLIKADLPLTFENETTLLYQGSVRLDFSRIFPVFIDFNNTLYIGPFRNIINTGTLKNYYDIEVGQAFVEKWRTLQTGNRRRDNEYVHLLTNNIAHIFDFENLEIHPAISNETLQLIINSKSFNLNEVGSGFAQFVLVIANAATRKPSYILIDEPELNLHPSLQIDFLTTLASYARKGIYFSTHSLGLAEATADRIYSFRRIVEGESQVRPYEATPRLAEFLGELSYGGYKAIGFDKVLLIEGRTGLKTLHQFLRLYKQNHKVLLLKL